VLSRLLSRSAASFDRVVGRAITGRSASARKKSRAESLGHEERLAALAEIERLYEAPSRETEPDAFFGAPRPFALRGRDAGTRSAKRATIEVVDVRWPSRVDPYVSAVAPSFKGVVENHEAAARLFLARGETRPAAIIIHGYRGGHYRFGERVWPVTWLLDHGIDVALFVLPFHAIRATPGSGPRFPASDPRFSNEGFRQAIGDLRDLVWTLRERGARDVGVMGMSLGGYTSSLLATVEPLSFVAPIIPLASLADIALEAGRLTGSPEDQRAQHAALEGAHRVVSPLTRPSRVPREGAIVVGGEGDRITPLSHAKKLSSHLGAELVTFPGGHILQFGRAEGFRAIGDKLRGLGLFRD
jgi:pimeloyl-ACP methyl ester carboxylesterase